VQLPPATAQSREQQQSEHVGCHAGPPGVPQCRRTREAQCREPHAREHGPNYSFGPLDPSVVVEEGTSSGTFNGSGLWRALVRNNAADRLQPVPEPRPRRPGG